jgi:hypothetical protein
MPMPTLTRVSRDARPLISRSSSQSTTPFSNRVTIVDPPSQDSEEFKKERYIGHTESKVSEFLASFDRIALIERCMDTPNHHSADAHGHDSSKLRTVNWNDLPYIFTINVKRGANGLRLTNSCQKGLSQTRTGQYVNGVIFPGNVCHGADDTVHGRVESMIVLWRQPKDNQSTTNIPF